DAITDVAGVEVGHRTLIAGSGKLIAGKGPVRTGVTAVFPRGKTSDDPVFAGWFTMNGNGEMTGTTWLEESGFLWGPVMITNTHSVGVVRDAVIAWALRQGRLPHDEWSLPVVAETWDGGLNDINGFHVTQSDAWAALDSARGRPGLQRTWARSSSWSPPTHRCSRTSSSGSRNAPPSGWAAWVGSRGTRRATSSSRSRPRTHGRPGTPGSPGWRCSRTSGSRR